MPSERNGQAQDPAMRRKVEAMLRGAPAFRKLDAPAQRDITDSLAQIAGYLGADGVPGLGALSGQMAPGPRLPFAPGRQPGGQQQPQQQPAQQPAPQQPAPTAGGGGAPARAADIARDFIGAIDFPSFVASLIQGTFQAIVDASIQQMEAYAEMLKNVAATVDTFMDDNITDTAARDYLADQYGGVFRRDVEGRTPVLRVNRDQPSGSPLPSFFKDLGFDSLDQIDDDSVEQVLVPAARRSIAERRQSVLATMVLMGMNRVVVDDGEITAKLIFHIDASEAMGLRFDQTKTTGGNLTGHAGRNPFSAQAIMVNTMSLNAQSDLNVRADLTGQVKVRFRSETFPLERFADSAAIQLINSNASVPTTNPTAEDAQEGANDNAPANNLDPWTPGA